MVDAPVGAASSDLPGAAAGVSDPSPRAVGFRREPAARPPRGDRSGERGPGGRRRARRWLGGHRWFSEVRRRGRSSVPPATTRHQ
ncbi:hypothetical protein C1701_00190 [Actinoalloteichus sp. AHMU CJ021]|nr:hypothetical protein C1701_00190 [Actinoalloteichus sp. AHMU CJ021]